MTAPVILVTLFRRADYTRRCLAALSECFNVGEVALLLSVDGPRNEEEAPAVAEVQEIAHQWKEAHKAKHPGAKVGLLLSQGNMGIDEHKLQTIPFAMEWAGADAFILLEDDTILAADGLNCLTTLLARSEADPAILSVSGYSWQETQKDFQAFADRGAYETVCPEGFCSWGWGMTQTVWDRLFADNAAQYRTDAAASGHAPDGVNGWFDSWMSCQRGRMLRPWIARIQNIGAEGGTHSTPRHHYIHDYNQWGAWDLAALPDHGLMNWSGTNAR